MLVDFCPQGESKGLKGFTEDSLMKSSIKMLVFLQGIQHQHQEIQNGLLNANRTIIGIIGAVTNSHDWLLEQFVLVVLVLTWVNLEEDVQDMTISCYSSDKISQSFVI